MMAFMHRLMYSCEEATFLTSKSMHQKLTFAQKQQLKWHLSMCKYCREYERNIKIINNGAKNINRFLQNGDPLYHLSNERKNQIKKTISNIS